LIQVGVDYGFEAVSHSLEGQVLRVWKNSGPQPAVEQLAIPLLGGFQVANAATAYAALLTFRQLALPVSDEAIRQGFQKASWPGRFELLQRSPALVVDSAHNRDSAHKLRLALDEYFPGKPVILVFGASEDKDIEGMFTELMPRVEQIVATQSFHPRAIEPEPLLELAGRFNKPARIVPDVAQALEEALALAGAEKLVLVAGSIFVAAGAREAWLAKQESRGFNYA
jgi:dihydrofolate synthase/folylpolyglutamate synthase